MPGTRGPVPVPLRDGNRDLTREILTAIDDKGSVTSTKDFPDIPQAEIKAALDRLGSRSMIEYDTSDKEVVQLSKEGEQICEEGSHEYKVWDAVRQKGRLSLKELPGVVGPESAKIGQGNAFRSKWIKKEGDMLVLAADTVQDSTRETLQKIRETNTVDDPKLLAELRKRKLATTAKAISYTARKGPRFAREMPVEVTDLTAEMLASGDWKSANFKPYNFKALGAAQSAGALHPLNKVRAEFRNIFFNQGFVEMPTGRYVESGFWNFDALFVPQQHPARDLQDTFYISDPIKADKPRRDSVAEKAMEEMEAGSRQLFSKDKDNQQSSKTPLSSSKTTNSETQTQLYEDYWFSIKQVHENGAFGSIGYRYPWSGDESLRLCLRTHTTAVSTWVLHRLARTAAQNGDRIQPGRYFSIDRVFRNETVDATHLAEFHQVEGVIADFDLTLGGLMRFLEDFFAKLGIENLRFKPAYNPYTEPSMEVFGYHRGLGKWVEIGNSGLFRPEMLLPMGLPADMRVYGFGLSLERPTMIKYRVSNIRELLGHKVDLGFIECNAAVRLDKD